MKIAFRKRIDGGVLHDDVFLIHVMEMPFCPPVGMLVFGENSVWECVVIELVWDHDRQQVEAWTEADDRMLIEGGHPAPIVEEWVDQGWEIDSEEI